MKNKIEIAGGVSVGIPSVVVGVLIALRHVGLIGMSYGSIILFGIEIWIVCAAFVLLICILSLILGVTLGVFK